MKKTFSATMALLLILAAASCRTAGNTTGRRHIVTTTADSGLGSLRDTLTNATDGDTITFAFPADTPGHDAVSGKWIIRFTGGEISFRHSLTIRGGGKIILDGCHKSRMLSYGGDRTLTLDGLTFQNCEMPTCIIIGNPNHDGGMVYAVGTVTATDCAFIGNEKTRCRGDGGAVYASGSASFTRCTFSGNKTFRSGGAVYVPVGTVTATDCVFVDNNASGPGGAVCAERGAVTLKDCTFTGNATTRGGAVCAGGIVTAVGCEFTRNFAGASGGAVCAGGAVTATDCAFTDNKSHGDGGAVFSYAAAVTAIGCVFSGNKADDGGAVFTGGSVTVTGGALTDNIAGGSGGAVCADGTVTATECAFTGNMAHGRDGRGGAVCAGASVAVSGCVFRNNHIWGFGGDISGGAVHTGGSATVMGCVFRDNSANGLGGAVYAQGGAVTAANSVFTYNRSQQGVKSGSVDAQGAAYLYHTTFAGNLRNTVYLRSDDGNAKPRLYAYNSIIVDCGFGLKSGYGDDKSFTAEDITGDSLIEGVTDGVTRAAIFGENEADENGITAPLPGGLADKTAGALIADGIAVPDGMTATDIIGALHKDITGAQRPTTGKVSFGARE